MKVDNPMSVKCAAVVAGVMLAAGSSMAMASVPPATSMPNAADNDLTFRIVQPNQQPSELIFALSMVQGPTCDDHCQNQQQVQKQKVAETMMAKITGTRFIV